MSSPNITFSEIPSSIRKPGNYGEFNLSAGKVGLPANPVDVLLIAQGLSTGIVDQLVPTRVFGAADASLYFGAGSIAHLATKAAFESNPYLRLTVITVDDSGTGVAATGTFALSGPATGAGVFTARIGNRSVNVAVASTDTASTVGAAIKAQIDLIAHELPVTATVDTGTVTLTARNKGTLGNEIPISTESTAAGLTCVDTGMASGANDPDIGATSSVLDTVLPGSYNLYISTLNDAASLGDLKAHIDLISNAIEQRPTLCVFGFTHKSDTYANCKTLCGTTLNHWRTTCGYLRGTRSISWEVAVAYGAQIAYEENPTMPLNDVVLKGIHAPAVGSRFSRTEQEDLLNSGVTPLHVVAGEEVAIVRAITTYTKNASSVADPTRLDISVPRALDFVRYSCRYRVTIRYPRRKNTGAFRKNLRSDLLDVLYLLEAPGVEVVQNMATWEEYLIVEEDSQDDTRVNARIPADIVHGAHVLAMRIDLL